MEEDNSRVSHTKGTFSSAELSFNLAVCCSLNGNIPKAIKFLESTKQEVDRDKKMAQSIETFISSLQTEKKLMFAPPKSNPWLTQKEWSKRKCLTSSLSLTRTGFAQCSQSS